MAQNNGANQDFTNNSDGYTLGGGTTERKLTVTGADMTLTGSGTNVFTFPAATDTLVGRASTDTLTNKDLSSSTNTFPDFYPVGTIYYNISNSANPSTYLPGQSASTWVQLTDVFIVASGSTYTGTGGAASATTDGGTAAVVAGGAAGTNRYTWNQTTGSHTHNVSTVPPYQAIYTWKRTA